MTDHLSKRARSENMSRIKGKDTGPEKAVRSLLFRMGYRFRLHRADLPGNPDVVLTRLRTVVFIHGCYWHRHAECRRGSSTPSTNTDFWTAKFARNVARDLEVRTALTELGWKVVVVWECETGPRNIDFLEARLRAALDRPGKPGGHAGTDLT